MANKKFSEFTLKTDSANVDFLVGYDGTDNVRIAPSNIGGGGAESLNDLTDVLVDGNSFYIGDIPSNIESGADDNITLGINAGSSLRGGDKNIIIGTQSGGGGSNATGNVIIGYRSGQYNMTAFNQVVIGIEAAQINGGNSSSVFIGYRAGQNSSGYANVAIGESAGRSSTASNYLSIGSKAGYSNTSGASNTNIGYQAGYSNTTGGYRTMLGWQAGASNTGSSNTFLGYQAGNATATGSNNIIIGSTADASSATVSNEITLGNSSISALRCQVQTISALSDSRDKTNIQPSPYGLDLISKLQPVTFDWNMRDGAKVGQKDLGFIAQELQEVDDENLQLVYDSNPDRLEASYGRLIPVLVQAIKELKAEVELLKNK